MPVSFRTYRSLSGRDEVEDWYAALPAEQRGHVRSVLDDLATTPEAEWDRPEYGHLTGKDWKGFHEIILKVKKQQIRLVGYWGPVRHEFVIVLLHNKNRSGKLTNHEAKTARDRRSVIESNPSRARIWLDAPPG